MKIKWGLLAAVLLILTMTGAFAEGVKDCTDDELVALLEDVQAELVSRRIEKTALLPAGTYVGGSDLPVGKYVLENEGIEGDYGIVSLRASDDPEDDYPSKLYDFSKAEQDYSTYITLEEGDKLILPYSFSLTISVGAKFE